MTQKVLKVGTSAAVTISKGALRELGLDIGDQVDVEINRNRRTVTIKPLVRVDKELIDWTEGFIKQYRPALEALAKK